MPVMITDPRIINEARNLRVQLYDKLSEWNKDVGHGFEQMNAHLSKLLSCHDPHFQFYNDESSITHVGVEPHVYEGLKALNGPHGYTIYKAMLVRQKATKIKQPEEE